jgi:CheY-like chemotaxis protein
LVEDEPLVQVIMAQQLEGLGFKVETAGSASQAMNKLKLLNGDIATAIIDIGLPDRSGDVLVAEMRAIYPLLPLVIASGFGEMLRNRFPGDDRIAFLSKPYTGEQLRRVLAWLNVAAT